MKLVKHTRLIVGLGLILLGLIVSASFFFHVPSREIARPEMEQLLQSGGFSKPVITPTPYAGIYHLETVVKRAGHKEKLFLYCRFRFMILSL